MNTSYEIVTLNDIEVPVEYQRPLEEKRVQHIIQNFDERLVSAPILSKRNGKRTMHVIDGQHLTEALKRLGKTEVEAKVFRHMSMQEEAQLFVAFNGAGKPVRAIDRHKAALVEGRPENLRVQELTQEILGKTIARGGEIECVGAMLDCLAMGELEFISALQMYAGPWSPWKVRGIYMKGLTFFFATLERPISEHKAEKVCKRCNPDIIQMVIGNGTSEGDVRKIADLLHHQVAAY